MVQICRDVPHVTTDCKGIVDTREKTLRLVCLSDAGRALVEGGIQYRPQVNQLTSEMLVSGQWRDVDLRPYDVSLRSEPAITGKEHPLVRVFQQTRRVFLEMGFSEISSPYVESSFWDFDALFQPQDHPARDMQDTLLLENGHLLRTHTSPVQIRTMLTNAPPIRVIAGSTRRAPTVSIAGLGVSANPEERARERE